MQEKQKLAELESELLSSQIGITEQNLAEIVDSFEVDPSLKRPKNNSMLVSRAGVSHVQ